MRLTKYYSLLVGSGKNFAGRLGQISSKGAVDYYTDRLAGFKYIDLES